MKKDNNEEMPTVTQVAQGAIVSNHVGKNGKSIEQYQLDWYKQIILHTKAILLKLEYWLTIRLTKHV